MKDMLTISKFYQAKLNLYISTDIQRKIDKKQNECPLHNLPKQLQFPLRVDPKLYLTK